MCWIKCYIFDFLTWILLVLVYQLHSVMNLIGFSFFPSGLIQSLASESQSSRGFMGRGSPEYSHHFNMRTWVRLCVQGTVCLCGKYWKIFGCKFNCGNALCKWTLFGYTLPEVYQSEHWCPTNIILRICFSKEGGF